MISGKKEINEKLELTFNHWILSLSALVPPAIIIITDNAACLLITPVGLLIDFFSKKPQLNNLSERFLQIIRALTVCALICNLFVMFLYYKQANQYSAEHQQINDSSALKNNQAETTAVTNNFQRSK